MTDVGEGGVLPLILEHGEQLFQKLLGFGVDEVVVLRAHVVVVGGAVGVGVPQIGFARCV